MGTTIIFRRGENDPTSGSGLTLAEPAFNTTLKTFHIGLGHGVTAAWVGAPISGLSADIAAGITYKIPTLAAVKNYIGGLCYGNTGAATMTEYVSSFNGLTGAVTGVTVGGANTFTALNSFNAGISASGATFSGTLSGATATFSSLVTSNGGISGDVNISSTNATGNMYLVMSRGAGVTALFVDDATTPLVYQPYVGNLGVKGLTIGTGNDRLYLTPTQITATNTVTPNNAYFYFVSPAIYLQSGDTAAMAASGSTRQLTWGDFVNSIQDCYFGVNRVDGGMCGDYAVEINHSTGKALQLIYNDYSGAASNWVNMNVTSGGDLTITPSGGDATISGRLFADNIVNALNGFTGGVTLAAGAGISMSAATGSVTITNTGVLSFNGLTGAVGGVCAAQANTFTAKQGFSAGVVVEGGLTANRLDITDGGLIRATDNPLSVGVSAGTPSSIDFDVYGNITLNSDNNTPVTVSYDQVLADVRVIANQGLTASSLNVTGNAIVGGNLTVSGGVTFTVSENVLIEDNIIILNSNVTGSPSENAGIEIERGTSANVQLLWNESSDKWTFTNDGSTYYDLPTSVVTSFNGNTGAVTGASLGANTFTGLQTLNAGLTTAFVYASTGSTFASTVQVSGGATFSGRVDVGGVLDVVGGTTLESTLDVAGAARFAVGLTSSGNIRFAGTSEKSIQSQQAALTIRGITTGVSLNGGNSIVFGIQNSDPLRLYSATGVFEFTTENVGGSPANPAFKIITYDSGTETSGSVQLQPITFLTGDQTQYFQDASGTLALTSQLMGTVNGSTAATTAVTSFNGVTGAVQGVSAAVAGTGIAVSGATGAVTITNIGVQSFNGNTGAVTGASLGANTFTGLQTLNAGLTTSFLYASTGSTFGSTVQVNGGATFASTLDVTGVAQFAGGVTFSGTVNGATATFSRIVTASAGLSASGVTTASVTNRGTSLVLTGATTGGLSVGSRITLPGSGSEISIVNNNAAVNISSYVTGTSTFKASLKFSTEDFLNETAGSVTITPADYADADYTLYLPTNTNGTLALTSQLMGAVNGSTAATTAVTSFNGLTGAVTGVTVGGVNTFTALNSFNAGISAAGGTFGATAAFNSSIVLQNSEFIQNTTDGRIDFMPAPASTTHYGMYLDFTSWGYGPRFGTIRSSDNATNTTGILWDAQLNLGNNVRFNFGANGQNGVVLSDTGNDTIQVFTDTTTGTNSGSLALVSSAGINHANRSPGTTHTNPNLYVYRAGTASANDFIRIEHDGTNANIVTGGSSAIDMEPGSGFVGFSGGISASGGITFSSTMRVAGTATFAGLINSTAGLSGTGITLSGNLSAATKSFVIPHPTKPQMTLQHGSLEGPENGVYVRGRLRGNDTITLPEYWRGLVHEDSITVNLTEIGDRNHHWVAYMGDYTITVASERGSVDCFYTVWGERKDVGKLPVEY